MQQIEKDSVCVTNFVPRFHMSAGFIPKDQWTCGSSIGGQYYKPDGH